MWEEIKKIRERFLVWEENEEIRLGSMILDQNGEIEGPRLPGKNFNFGGK